MNIRQLVTAAASTVMLTAGAAALSMGVGAGTAAATAIDSCSNPGYSIPYANPWGVNDYSYCQNAWEKGWTEPDCTGVTAGIANKALENECVGSPRTYPA